MYALITGASSGIGREIALLLAQKKYDLIISARRLDRLNSLRDKIIKETGVNVIVFACDLSSAENAQKLFEQCKPYDVGILVNNAGFGKIGDFNSIPLQSEIDMINTNITSLHILTKLFSDKMQEGHILNVASMAAFQPGPKMAAYAATKAYVLSMTLAVNYELKKANKKVYLSALCPGPVDTEFNDVANAQFKVRAISAKRCALIAVNGMLKKKALIIPSALMKITRLASKLLPLRLITAAEYRIQGNKKKMQTDN